MKNNKHAGAGTGTLSNAMCRYLAVRSGDEVFGVLGIYARKVPWTLLKTVCFSQS